MAKPSLLLPGYEVEPAAKVPKTHAQMCDSGATPYKVKEGDTLATLAIFARMNAKNLLSYNFGTTEPKEVNWYLRNHIGCIEADWDKKNYKFSDGDDPGVIFFPNRHYRYLIESGILPTPIVEDEIYNVPGVVPHYVQFGYTCWAAAFGMMLGWKHGKEPLPDLLEAHAGLKWRRLFEKRKAVYTEDIEELASDCRLVGHGACPANLDYWLSAIRKRGALCIGQFATSGWDHWVVACGFEKIFPDERRILYKDPGRHGGTEYDHVENIAAASRKYSYASALPIFYHF